MNVIAEGTPVRFTENMLADLLRQLAPFREGRAELLGQQDGAMIAQNTLPNGRVNVRIDYPNDEPMFRTYARRDIEPLGENEVSQLTKVIDITTDGEYADEDEVKIVMTVAQLARLNDLLALSEIAATPVVSTFLEAIREADDAS